MEDKHAQPTSGGVTGLPELAAYEVPGAVVPAVTSSKGGQSATLATLAKWAVTLQLVT